MWETRFNPWVKKIPWRRKWQPTPIPLPGKSHGRRSLVGYNPWGRKESDMTKQLTHTLIYKILLNELAWLVEQSISVNKNGHLKIYGRQWEIAVWPRELKQGPCDNSCDKGAMWRELGGRPGGRGPGHTYGWSHLWLTPVDIRQKITKFGKAIIF